MSLTLTLAQLNVIVGDFKGNLEKMTRIYQEASERKVDLVVFSELTITGYPPEDLLLRPRFRQEASEAINALAEMTSGNPTGMLFGNIHEHGGNLYNAAFLVGNGAILGVTHKHALPNYGVFDEKRYFAAAPLPAVMEYKGIKLGVMICEDMWGSAVAGHLAKQGAELLITLNASPFEKEKPDIRSRHAANAAKMANAPLVYVNQVGGQDALVFDGHSFVVSATGTLHVTLPEWQEQVQDVTFTQGKQGFECSTALTTPLSMKETTYQALVVGLRDYVNKNGFPGVILGLSGGIDSALTAAIAVDALGAERVRCVMMPSRYTSHESLEDAAQCAKMLGCNLDTISIEPTFKAYLSSLKEVFEGRKEDLTEENLQSRIRGMLLMAMSNKLGLMVLTTGNKSEMAVGYATLYGDMCGGYSVLKDVYKTDVVTLAKWRNSQSLAMPERVITKPPSAELRRGQKDEHSLLPYAILDDILVKFIERQMSAEDIIKSGHKPENVQKVARLIRNSEYKRYQSAPGVKVSGLAFGKDRRYPLTMGWEY